MKPMYVIILVIVFAAVGFYGGVSYQMSKVPSSAGSTADGRFGGRGFRGGASGMKPVNGQIVSQSNNAITVKLSDGTSKLVDLTSQTMINISSKGSITDLISGQRVTAFGTTNSDGSITAQAVNIGSGMFRAHPNGSQGGQANTQQ